MKELKENIENLIKNNQIQEAVDCFKRTPDTRIVQWLFQIGLKDPSYPILDLAFEYKEHFVKNDLDILKSVISVQNVHLLKYLVEKKVSTKGYPNDLSLELKEQEEYLIAYAGGNGNVKIIDYLVEQGLSVNSNNSLTFSWACSHNKKENVEHLIKNYGCSPNHHATVDMNVLSWATKTLALDAIEALLENGADVEQSDNLALKTLIVSYITNKDKERKIEKMLDLYLRHINNSQVQKIADCLENQSYEVPHYKMFLLKKNIVPELLEQLTQKINKTLLQYKLNEDLHMNALNKKRNKL